MTQENKELLLKDLSARLCMEKKDLWKPADGDDLKDETNDM